MLGTQGSGWGGSLRSTRRFWEAQHTWPSARLLTSRPTPRASIAAGQGPYFYLPKMESHLEARLWNDAFNLAQDMMGIPRGTIRATCLIETIVAAFEMVRRLNQGVRGVRSGAGHDADCQGHRQGQSA